MKYGDKHMIHTDLYKPNPAKACERCIFGSGQHAEWCSKGAWDRYVEETVREGLYDVRWPADAGCAPMPESWIPDRRPGDPGYVGPK